MKHHPLALLRAADLSRRVGAKLAAWHDDQRTQRRYERNAAKLEQQAAKAKANA